MRVRVLGSGASDGWPNPWCRCRSCSAAREEGVLRKQSSVLVDDVLLVDLGPGTAAAGVDLSQVRTVLVTHRHVDHHFPQAWVWWSWAETAGSLTVLAPPSVLAEAGRLDKGIRTQSVAPGDEVQAGEHLVRVLDAEHVDDAVLYDVTGPDGARLLYASDTGVLPDSTVEGCRDRDYDLVLLELAGTPIPTHLTQTTWPAQVQRLREVGAITERTRLLATHLGHHNPPPSELDGWLASHGAAALRDGQLLDTSRGHRLLVLGGQSSGKSAYAESRVSGVVTYVATAPPRPDDPDWVRRVAAHADRRPARWQTVETADVAGVLARPGGPVLVDDLGLWLTCVLDAHWDDGAGARAAFDLALDALLTTWETTARDVVLVAPEVGSGVVPDNAAARLFADLLGRATTALAGRADEVVQVVAGQPRRLR